MAIFSLVVSPWASTKITGVCERIFSTASLERLKGIFEDRLHEGPGLDVDHAHLSLRCFEHDRSAAGRTLGIIHRAQQTRLRVDEGNDFLLVPDVVAGRYHGDSRAQKIDGDFRRDPAAARGVLAIDDDEIERVQFLQTRQMRDHGATARFAHHVAEKKNRQHPASIVLNRRKSKP